MYIELRCKNCNKIFSAPLDEEEMTISECPKCRTHFKNNYLAHLAEVYYATKTHCHDDEIELLGLVNGKKDIVFKTDIDSLNTLYATSSEDVRGKMSQLFDLFYLLMFHNSKDGKLDKLDETIKEVRKVYNKKCGHPENFLIDEDCEIG